jgi:hypothetical protein
MARPGTQTEARHAGTPMDFSHLRREARTALELAIVALAPSALVDRLATAAGLLEALVELPKDSACDRARSESPEPGAKSLSTTGRNGTRSIWEENATGLSAEQEPRGLGGARRQTPRRHVPAARKRAHTGDGWVA